MPINGFAVFRAQALLREYMHRTHRCVDGFTTAYAVIQEVMPGKGGFLPDDWQSHRIDFITLGWIGESLSACLAAMRSTIDQLPQDIYIRTWPQVEYGYCMESRQHLFKVRVRVGAKENLRLHNGYKPEVEPYPRA
jgi:hypothetical protein